MPSGTCISSYSRVFSELDDSTLLLRFGALGQLGCPLGDIIELRTGLHLSRPLDERWRWKA